MSIKSSSILFPILSIITLLIAGGITGAFALLITFAAATVFLAHMAATTLARLCRPLASACCRLKRRVPGRSPW